MTGTKGIKTKGENLDEPISDDENENEIDDIQTECCLFESLPEFKK